MKISVLGRESHFFPFSRSWLTCLLFVICSQIPSVRKHVPIPSLFLLLCLTQSNHESFELYQNDILISTWRHKWPRYGFPNLAFNNMLSPDSPKGKISTKKTKSDKGALCFQWGLCPRPQCTAEPGVPWLPWDLLLSRWALSQILELLPCEEGQLWAHLSREKRRVCKKEDVGPRTQISMIQEAHPAVGASPDLPNLPSHES